VIDRAKKAGWENSYFSSRTIEELFTHHLGAYHYFDYQIDETESSLRKKPVNGYFWPISTYKRVIIAALSKL